MPAKGTAGFASRSLHAGRGCRLGTLIGWRWWGGLIFGMRSTTCRTGFQGRMTCG
jgi:hypothetical protein